LTNLPSELGQLASLEELRLHCNKLTSVPAELSHLAALKRLRVTNNPKLTSLPAAFFQHFVVALDNLDDRLQVDDTLRTLITAAERFTEAAESGDDKGRVLLAQCCLQERGVGPNAELGMCYAEGVGIVKSVCRAVKHFRSDTLLPQLRLFRLARRPDDEDGQDGASRLVLGQAVRQGGDGALVRVACAQLAASTYRVRIKEAREGGRRRCVK
jgi:hypothetical protein